MSPEQADTLISLAMQSVHLQQWLLAACLGQLLYSIGRG